MEEDLDCWFVREILPHEVALVRYLHHRCGNRDDVQEFRQEVYTRVYQAALSSRPRMPKSFLFATARHLLADHLRRERVVSIESKGDFDALNVLVDELSPERRETAGQQLKRLMEAFDCLPHRCREVLWMCRVEELSQKEVAASLGITRKTVEKHVAKGIRLLADAFHASPSQEHAAQAATWTHHGRTPRN